jgi:sugar-specific transcriptional regulator TrmB
MAGEIQSSAGSTPAFMFPAQPDWVRDSKIEELGNQVTKLTEQVDRLERVIEKMSDVTEIMQSRSEEVMVLRSITRDEAKKEIIDLLDKSEKLYYYDIAEALRLDLEQVVDLMSELESEGVVGVAE